MLLPGARGHPPHGSALGNGSSWGTAGVAPTLHTHTPGPALPPCRCGSIFWLKHRVRLSELWVLCSEEAAAARPEEEEEEVFGLKCSRTLILVWPTNLCVVTFG